MAIVVGLIPPNVFLLEILPERPDGMKSLTFLNFKIIDSLLGYIIVRISCLVYNTSDCNGSDAV